MTGLSPSGIDALTRAIAAHRAGDLAAAEPLYRLVLQHAPDQFEALHMLGVLEAQRGHHENALAILDRAVAADPGSVEALSNRGAALQAVGRPEDALASFDKALAIRPDVAETHNNRGNALRDLKRYEEALACYDKALALKPAYPEALNNRGTVLQELARLDDALASFDKALAEKPDYVNALSNRGVVLYALNRLDEALASYDRALRVKPDYAGLLSDRGVALQNLGRPEDALASFDRALALKPDHVGALWNESLCRLLVGDFKRGWEQYEWREQAANRDGPKRDFGRPLWLGKEAIAGKTILLHAEQGLGDTIQFCRYVPMVAAKGARVVLEVQSGLKSLLRNLRGLDLVFERREALPPYDYHTPLMSLPLAFGTSVDGIPGEIPYLAADPVLAAAWRGRLASFDGAKIGLVWAGNPRLNDPGANLLDRRRSLHLSQLAKLARAPGAVFVSLQKGEPAKEARTPPAGMTLIDWTEELSDFADTAALIAGLDFVISVDTSVAHLAGALGKPVWLLNRFDTCWRWFLDREDSPWYPTMRIFRQPAFGDWESVIARVAAELGA